MLHGYQSVLQPVPRALVVVDVARGDHAEPQLLGERGQAGDAARIPADQVVLQLEEGVASSETACQPPRGLAGVGNPPRIEQARHLPVAAPREHDEAGRLPGERRRIERHRVARARAVGFGDQAAEVGVALRGLGEEGQMDRAGGPVVEPVAQRQLDAGDRLETHGGTGLSKGHRAVQAIVVGDGERAVAQRGRPGRQLLRLGGAVQQRVAGVEVQLGIAGVAVYPIAPAHGAGLGGSGCSNQAPVTRSW